MRYANPRRRRRGKKGIARIGLTAEEQEQRYLSELYRLDDMIREYVADIAFSWGLDQSTVLDDLCRIVKGEEIGT